MTFTQKYLSAFLTTNSVVFVSITLHVNYFLIAAFSLFALFIFMFSLPKTRFQINSATFASNLVLFPVSVILSLGFGVNALFAVVYETGSLYSLSYAFPLIANIFAHGVIAALSGKRNPIKSGVRYENKFINHCTIQR